MMAKFFRTLHALHEDQSGQDLIEYALANSINSAFSAISTELHNAIS